MNNKRVALLVLGTVIVAGISVGAGIGIGSAIFKSSSTGAPNNENPTTTKSASATTTASSVATTTTTTTTSAPLWLSPFQQAANSIFSYLVNGDGKGVGYKWLANLTDIFGNRMVGSERIKNATEYVVNYLRAQGFNNVRTEQAPIKSWVRGEETAVLISPRRYTMSILGLGWSVPTPPEGITAPAIVVDSFDELDAAGREKINGTIVVYNEPWLGSYGATGRYRAGASRASYYGALAVLVRSVTPFSIYSPHTGVGPYLDQINGTNITKIPQASLTVEDAMMLRRMQDRGQKLTIYLRMTSHDKDDVGNNIMFEWTGSQYPNEYVVFSGHFDSWDVGQGAMDDGGGCALAWNTLTTLRNLGLQPKRTIRGIFWIGEELDSGGVITYFNQHKNSIEKWIFAFESDEGAFKPSGTANNTYLAVNGNATAVQRLQDIAAYTLAVNGILFSVQTNPYAGGEVMPWADLGAVTASYLNDEKFYGSYFYFQHSNGDTMTVFKEDDLDYVTAVMATYAHIIANMDKQLSSP